MAITADGLIACVSSTEHIMGLKQPGSAILDMHGQHITPVRHLAGNFPILLIATQHCLC